MESWRRSDEIVQSLPLLAIGWNLCRGSWDFGAHQNQDTSEVLQRLASGIRHKSFVPKNCLLKLQLSFWYSQTLQSQRGGPFITQSSKNRNQTGGPGTNVSTKRVASTSCRTKAPAYEGDGIQYVVFRKLHSTWMVRAWFFIYLVLLRVSGSLQLPDFKLIAPSRHFNVTLCGRYDHCNWFWPRQPDVSTFIYCCSLSILRYWQSQLVVFQASGETLRKKKLWTPWTPEILEDRSLSS